MQNQPRSLARIGTPLGPFATPSFFRRPASPVIPLQTPIRRGFAFKSQKPDSDSLQILKIDGARHSVYTGFGRAAGHPRVDSGLQPDENRRCVRRRRPRLAGGPGAPGGVCAALVNHWAVGVTADAGRDSHNRRGTNCGSCSRVDYSSRLRSCQYRPAIRWHWAPFFSGCFWPGPRWRLPAASFA
jgi:hypothetical protein